MLNLILSLVYGVNPGIEPINETEKKEVVLSNDFQAHVVYESHQIKVELKETYESFVTIALTDRHCSELEQKRFTEIKDGVIQTSFSTKDLAKGLYFIKIDCGYEIRLLRVVVP